MAVCQDVGESFECSDFNIQVFQVPSSLAAHIILPHLPRAIAGIEENLPAFSGQTRRVKPPGAVKSPHPPHKQPLAPEK